MMENELVGKQHEIEELNRELEEMRATYGTEGLQQVCLPYASFVTKTKIGNLNGSLHTFLKDGVFKG